MSAQGRKGFTFVEVLVVSILGTLILLAAYETLLTTRQATTAHQVNMEGRQALRAAAQVLTGEIREASQRGDDLLEMSEDAIEVRSASAIGLVCDIDYDVSPPRLRVLAMSGSIQPADSIVVLADNDPDTRADDAWIMGTANSVSSGASCPDGSVALDLRVGGLGVVDSVRTGAPLRVFRAHRYSLMTVDGDTYLALRRGNDSSAEPVVGPLGGAGREGMTLQYFDENGSATTDPGAVSWIQITLRTPISSVGGGRTVSDSLMVRVHPRN